MCFLLFTSAGVPHPQKNKIKAPEEPTKHRSSSTVFPCFLCLCVCLSLSVFLSLCAFLIILWHSSGCDAFISMQILNAAGQMVLLYLVEIIHAN